LKNDQVGLNVSYPTVARFIRQFNDPEVYVPLHTKPAEEAQVDFGYFGRFVKDGKLVKVWGFSMVLSNSRYSYNCLVTDQSVATFINCHIKSFEYFGGAPQTVKIDNLKAGVIHPNFYEPVIQRQYAEFLDYYGSAPITARIRRGQDKGKVESNIKYLKNNFLKAIKHNDFYQLEKDILQWTNNTANKRLHGTTKKVPEQVFNDIEKEHLIALPPKRFEILKIENRKVNRFAHISFKNNYYSVPCKYVDYKLTIKYSDYLLKIYDDLDCIAIHQICDKQGQYITVEEHKPIAKQRKTQMHYVDKANSFGSFTREFLNEIMIQKPLHWHKQMQGIFSLEKSFSKQIINSACKRALDYNLLSYSIVKNICSNKLYDIPKQSLVVKSNKGFKHDLKKYDFLTS